MKTKQRRSLAFKRSRITGFLLYFVHREGLGTIISQEAHSFIFSFISMRLYLLTLDRLVIRFLILYTIMYLHYSTK